MKNHAASRLRKFRSDDEGSIIIEAVIMIPMLIACVIAMFVFFDAFRNQSINLKAAYTISDALSREEQTIDNNYIVNSWRLHRFLSNSQTLTRLRVTVIQYDDVNKQHLVSWSASKGGMGEMTQGMLDKLVTNDQIPVMPHLDTLIIVQTAVNYTPAFTIGLRSFNFENMIFTRPRFAPQLCYSYSGNEDTRTCPIGT